MDEPTRQEAVKKLEQFTVKIGYPDKMTPQTINAYFNPVQNEIVFPAAILQELFSTQMLILVITMVLLAL